MLFLRKFILVLFLIFCGMFSVFGSTNVIDVSVTEQVYEYVTFNSLGSTVGTYASSGENFTEYNITGTIVVKNNHSNEPISDVVLNFSSIGNVLNLAYSTGSNGIVTDFNVGGDYATLLIPDLAAGANSTFTYYVDTSSVAPPLNLTSNFSDTAILAGLNFAATDTIKNEMSTLDYSDTCIYDISVIQSANTISTAGGGINFTFSNTSLSGSDVTNAAISTDNKTVTWNVWNTGCLESSNSTDISYTVEVPLGFDSASDYQFSNSTISYSYNSTISNLTLTSIKGVADLEMEFQKYMNAVLPDDNATWKITSEVDSLSNITVNLTSVTLWVSQRNGTGTGFTNPSLIDNDTVNNTYVLQEFYNPNVFMNSTTGVWNNIATEWYFNYTQSASPIVWMDLDNEIVDDGVQLYNKSFSYSDNSTYIKEIYVATGYWLEITKNITRLSDSNYNVLIKVVNLGSSSTPTDQAVIVYNFLPTEYSLTSGFVYSVSPWYNTTETNETLNDPTYNGTMYQYALIPDGNPTNSSLSIWGGSENVNNTWTVDFNISGTGEFAYDDLFLTGVDPLNVEKVGGTKSIGSESMYRVVSATGEYVLVGLATVLGALIFLL